jgi:hypothetical protein
VGLSPGGHYGVAFCGGGPATTGILVCASEQGRLDALLGRGTCIIEQSPVIGPGAIGHYPISANTRGGTFLAWLDHAEPRQAFDAARDAGPTHALARFATVFPRLPLVGEHLASLGDAMRARVESVPGCSVVTEHTVREITLLDSGGAAITFHSVRGGAETNVTADRAVIAMGARPRADLGQLILLPGLGLRAYAHKLCHANAVIDGRIGLGPQLRRAIARTRQAVVVGGSHSAWSAAWAVIHDRDLRDDQGRPPRVTVLHRSPLRFYFRSVARARAAGYVFDESADVCPQTGLVNRHGGLRADAHRLAWAATHPGRADGPVRAISLVDEEETRAAAAQALDGAGAIIAAVGYEANLPRITWPDGRPIRLATNDTGLQVTAEARLVSAEGTELRQLLAFGLGAGQAATGALAGEPSYTGRLDAVRLYQNEVGGIVLDSLLGSARS